MRLLKAKRLLLANSWASSEGVDTLKQTESTRVAWKTDSPSMKYQQQYLRLVKKFITFANSICILYIQYNLRHEAYELLKKWSYFQNLQVYKEELETCSQWKGHLLFNYILCHYFNKSSFTIRHLEYVIQLAGDLDSNKVRDWDFLWAIYFFAFYIFWKDKQYEVCVKYLKYAQSYLNKIMDEDIPPRRLIFDQVQEVDEETEREPSISKSFKKVINEQAGRNRNLLKTIGASYYDSSDSEFQYPQEQPSDQYQRFESKNKIVTHNQTDYKKSRLSQLSKFNLFALIELANALLLIKLQNNTNEALFICNETINTIKMLSEKIKSPIVTQDLLESLSSQIMEHKLKELDIDEIVTGKSVAINQDKENRKSSNFPSHLVMAISESTAEIKNQQKEFKSHKMNIKKIFNSKEFHSLLIITTLVPFIKSGIPRLNDFDIKRQIFDKKLPNDDKEAINFENVLLEPYQSSEHNRPETTLMNLSREATRSNLVKTSHENSQLRLPLLDKGSRKQSKARLGTRHGTGQKSEQNNIASNIENDSVKKSLESISQVDKSQSRERSSATPNDLNWLKSSQYKTWNIFEKGAATEGNKFKLRIHPYATSINRPKKH